MSKVINRKNLVIGHDSDNGNTFKKVLNLSFQPDTMVVKLITANGAQIPDNKDIDAYIIYCNNLNEIIGSFFDGSSSTPNLTFNVSNATINTEWSFELQNYDGSSTADDDNTAVIIIHLEFLQHEK